MHRCDVQCDLICCEQRLLDDIQQPISTTPAFARYARVELEPRLTLGDGAPEKPSPARARTGRRRRRRRRRRRFIHFQIILFR